jgi:hypothetical protein
MYYNYTTLIVAVIYVCKNDKLPLTWLIFLFKVFKVLIFWIRLVITKTLWPISKLRSILSCD